MCGSGKWARNRSFALLIFRKKVSMLSTGALVLRPGPHRDEFRYVLVLVSQAEMCAHGPKLRGKYVSSRGLRLVTILSNCLVVNCSG